MLNKIKLKIINKNEIVWKKRTRDNFEIKVMLYENCNWKHIYRLMVKNGINKNFNEQKRE